MVVFLSQNTPSQNIGRRHSAAKPTIAAFSPAVLVRAYWQNWWISSAVQPAALVYSTIG
jgi:hypothetical protein